MEFNITADDLDLVLQTEVAIGTRLDFAIRLPEAFGKVDDKRALEQHPELLELGRELAETFVVKHDLVGQLEFDHIYTGRIPTQFCVYLKR